MERVAIPKPLLTALICTPLALVVLFLVDWPFVARACLALFACLFVAAVLSRWRNSGSSVLSRGGPGGAAARQTGRRSNAAARSPSNAPAEAPPIAQGKTSPLQEDQPGTVRRESIKPFATAVSQFEMLKTGIETAVKDMGNEVGGQTDEEATKAAQDKENKDTKEINKTNAKLNREALAAHTAEVERLTKAAQDKANSLTKANEENELKRAIAEARSIAEKNRATAQEAEDKRVASVNELNRKAYDGRKKAFQTQGNKIGELLKQKDTAQVRAKLRSFLSGPKEKGTAASGEMTRGNALAWLERSVPQQKGVEHIMGGFKRKDWGQFPTATTLGFVGSSETPMDNNNGISDTKRRKALEIFDLVQQKTPKGEAALIDVYRTLVTNNFQDAEPALTPKEREKLEAMTEFSEQPPKEETPNEIQLVEVKPEPRFVPKVAPVPITIPKLVVIPLVKPKTVRIRAKPVVNIAPSVVKANPANVKPAVVLPLVVGKIKPRGKVTAEQKKEIAKELLDEAIRKTNGDTVKALEDAFGITEADINDFLAEQGAKH